VTTKFVSEKDSHLCHSGLTAGQMAQVGDQAFLKRFSAPIRKAFAFPSG